MSIVCLLKIGWGPHKIQWTRAKPWLAISAPSYAQSNSLAISLWQQEEQENVTPRPPTFRPYVYCLTCFLSQWHLNYSCTTYSLVYRLKNTTDSRNAYHPKEEGDTEPNVNYSTVGHHTIRKFHVRVTIPNFDVLPFQYVGYTIKVVAHWFFAGTHWLSIHCYCYIHFKRIRLMKLADVD